MLGGDKSERKNILDITDFPKDGIVDLDPIVKEKCDQVKKEMYYRFAIAVFASAFVHALVWRGADVAVEVLNQLSLASSMASIFLAFVASI